MKIDPKLPQFIGNLLRTSDWNQKNIDEATNRESIWIESINMDYGESVDKKDFSTLGQYILDPQNQTLSLRNIPQEKIKSLPMVEFILKPRWQVAEYVAKTYGKTHYLPGFELIKQFLDEPQSRPTKVIPSGGHLWYFFPGSKFRDHEGLWCLPCITYSENKWGCCTFWLKDGWHKHARMIIIEK